MMYQDDFKDDRKNPKKENIIAGIRMTLSRDQIMTFVSGLHETQNQLIEAVVYSREKQGFPEATAVLKAIMERK